MDGLLRKKKDGEKDGVGGDGGVRCCKYIKKIFKISCQGI
jgi:hypothetical protein